MDNLSDWYRASMAPPTVRGGKLVPTPVYGPSGMNVAKTYTTRLGQDVPASQAQLAIDDRFAPSMPATAMAFAPPASAVPVPMPRARPGSAPNAMDLAAMAAPPRTMTTSTPRAGGNGVNTLATPQNGVAGLFSNLGKGNGLLSLLLGQNGTPQQGGLLGMLFGNHGAADAFRGAMTGQSAKPQRITAPGGGGAFIAAPGSPASDAGAGSGSLLPASMNSTRWNTGY